MVHIQIDMDVNTNALLKIWCARNGYNNKRKAIEHILQEYFLLHD